MLFEIVDRMTNFRRHGKHFEFQELHILETKCYGKILKWHGRLLFHRRNPNRKNPLGFLALLGEGRMMTLSLHHAIILSMEDWVNSLPFLETKMDKGILTLLCLQIWNSLYDFGKNIEAMKSSGFSPKNSA